MTGSAARADQETGWGARRVLIVGTGLIGASAGLALRRRDVEVALEDLNAAHLRVAVSVGAGAAGVGGDPDVVLVAVPPSHAAATVLEALGRFPAAYVSDLASAKQAVLARVRAGVDRAALARYVGSHPMAGSERSGPLAAQADLFDGRTWAVTPHEDAAPEAVEAVEALARLCGATPVRLTPAAHDEAVALVSHTPHVAACLVSSLLATADDAKLTLAGQGLRDVTRVAGSDPELWTQILSVNAGPVARLLHEAARELELVARTLDDLDGAATAPGPAPGGAAEAPTGASQAPTGASQAPTGASQALRGFLERAGSGVRRLPGKHGRRPDQFVAVPVVVPDRPGSLAQLFELAVGAGVNIEDVRIDHSPGAPAGLVELFVTGEAEGPLLRALGGQGWTVHR